jgi:peroxiredoxin
VPGLARALALVLALAAGAATAQGLKPWTGGATPPLALADLQGRTHSLAQYRGKVVLVNFWATWCGPCREEMPSLRELRKSLAGRPFEVLAVNLAEPEARIERFLDKVPLDFPILLDRDTKVARAWQARILPASFVIGPDGRIRYHHAGELDWSKEEVRRLIAGLLPR